MVVLELAEVRDHRQLTERRKGLREEAQA